jgi:hypothetical protein
MVQVAARPVVACGVQTDVVFKNARALLTLGADYLVCIRGATTGAARDDAMRLFSQEVGLEAIGKLLAQRQ